MRRSVGPRVGLSSLSAVEGAPSWHGSRCTRTAWKTSGPASRIAPPRLVSPSCTVLAAGRPESPSPPAGLDLCAVTSRRCVRN